MDKSTAIKIGVGSAAAAGSVTGGYFIHQTITSSSSKNIAVQNSTTSDQPKPLSNESSKERDSDLPPLPPSPEISYIKPPAQENSIALIDNTTYKNYELGKEFDTVLLASKAPLEKWKAKEELLKSDSPKSKDFKDIKTSNLSIAESIKSKCKISYSLEQNNWGRYGNDWTDDERGNFWSDIWNYCTVEEKQEIPAIWPYSAWIKGEFKNT